MTAAAKPVRWALVAFAFALIADIAYCPRSYLAAMPDAFSRGPLTYVLMGAGAGHVHQLVFARIALALVFAASIAYYGFALPLKRFLFAAAAIVFAAFLLTDPTPCVTAVAFVAMLIVARKSKHQPYEAIVLGIFTGVAFLMKPLLGLEFAAAIGVVLIEQHGRELAIFAVTSVATATAFAANAVLLPAIAASLWTLCIAALIVNVVMQTNTMAWVARRLSAGAAALAALVLLVTAAVKRPNSDNGGIVFSGTAATHQAPQSITTGEVTMDVLLCVLFVLVMISQRTTAKLGTIGGALVLGALNLSALVHRTDTGHALAFLMTMLLLCATSIASAGTPRRTALASLAFAVTFFCYAVISLDRSPIATAYHLTRLAEPLRDLSR